MTARNARWAYFDTSALVKRYVNEGGRSDVLQLLHRHRCVTSAVHAVELRSALRRRVGDGSLEGPRLSSVLARIAADRAYWTQIDVARDVLADAARLVAAYPLRTLDAIHVASAQIFATRMMTTGLLFVSADVHQTDAAARLGMTIRLIES